MENPATWGELERVISKALDQIDDARAEFMCGLSAERQIADALREAGLIKE